MTFALHGTPVSNGIAIGKAVLISRAALEVSHHLIEVGKEEIESQKLLDAFEQVRLELAQLRKGLPKDAPQEMAAFLDVHGMILSDPALTEKPLTLIRLRFSLCICTHRKSLTASRCINNDQGVPRNLGTLGTNVHVSHSVILWRGN